MTIWPLFGEFTLMTIVKSLLLRKLLVLTHTVPVDKHFVAKN
jgi:hypothetical protein